MFASQTAADLWGVEISIPRLRRDISGRVESNGDLTDQNLPFPTHPLKPVISAV